LKGLEVTGVAVDRAGDLTGYRVAGQSRRGTVFIAVPVRIEVDIDPARGRRVIVVGEAVAVVVLVGAIAALGSGGSASGVRVVAV
jgi:hypothetical protein